MPKTYNKHAINLYESIGKHIGHTEAEDFLEKFPLSVSADYIKKFKWAKSVCTYLEECYFEDKLKDIRMDCSCDPRSRAEKVKKIYECSSDLSNFCERFNKEYDQVTH